MRILSYILFFCLAAGLSHVHANKKGQVNLSGWDRKTPVNLSASWAFYPSKFVLPVDRLVADQFVSIDKAWNDVPCGDSTMGAKGKATYSLDLLLPQANVKYGIDLGSVSSSFAMYLNDSLIAKAGNPYGGAKNYRPAYSTDIITFRPKSKNITITLHVANYRYNVGGIWNSVVIDDADDLARERKSRINLLLILFGGILLMSFYHFGLYMLRRNERSSLFFFLWTLPAGFRLLFSGRYFPALELFYVPWEWIIRIEYLTFYLAIPLFIAFVAVIFPKNTHKLIVRIGVAIGAVFVLPVLFLPVSVFTGTVSYYQIYTFVGILYILFVLFKALQKRTQGAGIFLIGFIGLSITVVHDIFVAKNLISHDYLFPAGLLFFVFLQAYLLASRFTETFARVEVLGRQLNYMNLHLEKIVDERTDKLQKANELLRQKNEEVSRQSDQMSIMNKELKKLSVAVSETDNAIIITDKSGQIEWVNRGFERLYGYSLGEMQHIFGNNLKQAGRSKNISNLFDKVISEKKSVNYEAEVLARDGTKIQVQTTLSPILDSDGEIVYLVAIDTDIREMKEVQKELRKSNSAKNKLFSIIAHDLRNPFNTLLGMTELIMIRFSELSKEELLSFIKDLNEVSRKTYYLLLNLLEWSRTQREKIVIKPQKLSLRPVIEETMEIFNASIEGKDQKLEMNVDANIEVYADPNSLKTVLRNLISNAIKFTPRNKSIFIEAASKNEKVEIKVRDEGIGIAPENLSHIFNLEGTYTSDGTENEKGTGLGLMLCKSFVEKNKGTIQVTSKVGEGTTFIIELPVSENNA